jgi:hypothetical protein
MLENIVGLVPRDFHLANILVAVLQENYFGIAWVPILSGTEWREARP